ncbi:MAG: hypothetical protein WDA59_01410 [Methanofastidiosum sp.]|jgi:hypothetical protein
MRKENTVIPFPYKKFEEVDDLNQDAVWSIRQEHKLLWAIKGVLNYIDSLDGILHNESHLNHCKKLLEKAIKENESQNRLDSSEQKILDKVHVFPEHLKKESA